MFFTRPSTFPSTLHKNLHSLFAYLVFFFACLAVRDLCRSRCRQNYYLTPRSLPPPSYLPMFCFCPKIREECFLLARNKNLCHILDPLHFSSTLHKYLHSLFPYLLFFFAYLAVRDLCRKVDVDRIIILSSAPSLLPPYVFFLSLPTILSLTK